MRMIAGDCSIESIVSFIDFMKSEPTLNDAVKIKQVVLISGDDSKIKILDEYIKNKSYKHNPKVQRKHVVYAATDGFGKFIYIGSGQDGRQDHCTSGVSTSYGLNKMHHLQIPFTVEVVFNNLTRRESLELERYMIYKHKPLFNVTCNR